MLPKLLDAAMAALRDVRARLEGLGVEVEVEDDEEAALAGGWEVEEASASPLGALAVPDVFLDDGPAGSEKIGACATSCAAE